MSDVYRLDDEETRKLKFVYKHSGVACRYSVLPDFSLPACNRKFFGDSKEVNPFPTLEQRMACFEQHAPRLATQAVDDCLQGRPASTITHLITVSCTGLSAPGLDIHLIETLGLPANTWRTSVNFMGCYAAMHALKIADTICKSNCNAMVLVACVELCTIHFQEEYVCDNMSSAILFADGAAAALLSGSTADNGLEMVHAYSSLSFNGKREMAWRLSSAGFQLKLSGYIPHLIEADFGAFVREVLLSAGLVFSDITHWGIHPGGKKILDAVGKSLHLSTDQLQHSYDILRNFGNMSSCTILFVLKRIQSSINGKPPSKIFSAAFGPGLTLEALILSS